MIEWDILIAFLWGGCSGLMIQLFVERNIKLDVAEWLAIIFAPFMVAWFLIDLARGKV